MDLRRGDRGALRRACVNADRTLTFVYGPEHQRVRQDVRLSSNAPSHMEAGTTWYLNGTDSQGLSYEKEVKANGTTEHKHYVNAGGVTFALYVKREGNLNGKPATSISYFHQDHLGSIAAITNEAGALVERMAFDPWGKRRFPNGTADTLDAIWGVSTDRGYTMHEHLDEMGVIHMNGRVFDPLIGRFMSADPLIQAPGNLQSYNRYAYVLNNPLAYTDPSGYFSLGKFFRSVLRFSVAPTAKNTFNMIAAQPGQKQVDNYIMTHQWAYSVGQVAASIVTGFCGGCCGAAWASYYTYQGTGSMNEAIKAGAIVYGTSVAFDAVGSYAPKGVGNVIGHAAVGCVSSVASGRQCGSGALAAGAGSMWSNYGRSFEGRAANVTMHAIVGGTVSVLGGGKFENRVVTAAFGYLYNQERHRDSRLAMADRAAGLDSSRMKTDAFEAFIGREFTLPSGREGWGQYLDAQSDIFGWASVVTASNPLTASSAPLLGFVGKAAGLASQTLNPRPVRLFTDELVNSSSRFLPKPAQPAAAQLLNSMKNVTPIGNQ